MFLCSHAVNVKPAAVAKKTMFLLHDKVLHVLLGLLPASPDSSKNESSTCLLSSEVKDSGHEKILLNNDSIKTLCCAAL